MASSRLSETAARFAGSPWAVSIVTIAMRLAVFRQLLPLQGTQGFYKYNEQARIAWAMVAGYGFSSPWINTSLLPTAQQPPLYPWLLAGIFKLTGPYTYTSLWIIELCNVIFAALTTVLILKVGRQMFGSIVGVLAAWTWACWLDVAVVSLRVWESSLSALLLMVGLSLVLRLKPDAPINYWLGFGISAGVAVLANPSLLSVFIGLWLWLFARQGSASCAGKIVLSIVFCLLTVLPWTVRNYVEFHRFLPVRDNFGFELWQENHVGEPDTNEFNRLGEIGFMEAKRDAAVQFIRDDPQRFVHGCLIRFVHFWGDPTLWVWLPLSFLTWLGCAFAVRKKGWEATPLAAPILLFPLVYYITHPGTYRHPVEPIMLLLAAFAIVTLAGKLRPARALNL